MYILTVQAMEGFQDAVREYKVLDRIMSKQSGHIGHDGRLHGDGYEKLVGEAEDIIKGRTALPEEQKTEKLRGISATLRDVIRAHVPDDVLEGLGEF